MRKQGDPAGHPRLRVVGAACVACLVVGTIIAPAQDTTTDPATQKRDLGGEERQRGHRETQEREAQAARAAAERRRRENARGSGQVTRVIDGDTVQIEGVGRVRLIGVDTPERGEECSEEATDYLKGRVAGRTVRYRYQPEREDRYDRALLDLYVGGHLINLDIAEAGWGEELTIAPNNRYADRIARAEREARAVPLGRWKGCFTQPETGPSRKPKPSPKRKPSPGGSGGGAPSGTCSEIGITDFPVPPGDPRDRDGDGIACES